MAPGGRKLKAVDSGMDLFGDDEDDKDAKRRREKEYGGEGDMDEMVYEEDFADDDEKVEAEGEDDEAKEIEVCCVSHLFPPHLPDLFSGTSEERVQDCKQNAGGIH